MVHDIKPYKQKGSTCGIACMLMVLEYYQIIEKANWIYEKKYDRVYRSKYTSGTPFSAIAWHLAKNGLNVELVHSEPNMFNNYDKTFPLETYNNLIAEYIEYIDYSKNKNFKVSNGIDISSEFLQNNIMKNKLIILAGKINGCLHAILLFGYENDEFIVCDPLYKHSQAKTKKEIEEFMNTTLGKWCIIVAR